MPAWNEYKQIAKDRGALALEFYVAESTPAKPMEDVKAVLPDHLAYQKSLEDSGKLAFAGPLSDETGEQMQGAGLVIYRAMSFAEAHHLAVDDPMHLTGARTFTLRRWLVNEGSLAVKIRLSNQAAIVE